VTRVAREVVTDFAADGVLYLELRTTPKENAAEGMTRHSYVESVLAGIESVCGPGGGDGGGVGITVRLLLSIDRRGDGAAAMETVLLAHDMRERGVVGIDLSGDPRVGNWETYLPALEEAKRLNLPITLHCGEIHNPAEVRAMLAFRPERLGHAVTAAADAGLLPELLAARIPVELCLTSNVMSETVHSYGCVRPEIAPTPGFLMFATQGPPLWGVEGGCTSSGALHR
jgi:adenosine deaminase